MGISYKLEQLLLTVLLTGSVSGWHELCGGGAGSIEVTLSKILRSVKGGLFFWQCKQDLFYTRFLCNALFLRPVMIFIPFTITVYFLCCVSLCFEPHKIMVENSLQGKINDCSLSSPTVLMFFHCRALHFKNVLLVILCLSKFRSALWQYLSLW